MRDTYFGGSKSIVLLKGSQALPAGPNKGTMKVNICNKLSRSRSLRQRQGNFDFMIRPMVKQTFWKDKQFGSFIRKEVILINLKRITV